jgi:hypothetical protein
MRGFLAMLLGTLGSGIASAALADLGDLVAHKLAARASSYGQEQEWETSFSWYKKEDIPLPSKETAAATEADRSPFNLGSSDNRFTTRSWKTGFAMAGGVTKAEIGYHGDLRLQFDRPTVGGNVLFSFVGDHGTNELRLEFKRNF